MFYKEKRDIRSLKEKKMSRDTAIVLASLVDKGEELLKIIRKEEKEEIDMCESIDNFRKKAVQEGMCLTILKQLNKKVGYLSSEVVTMIENSSREQLEKLAVEIVSIKDEHDIFVLLQSY